MCFVVIEMTCTVNPLMNIFLHVSLTWKWLLRPLLTISRTPSICRGNTSKQTTTSRQVSYQPCNRSKSTCSDKPGSRPLTFNMSFTFTLAMTLIKGTRIRERFFCLLLSQGSVCCGDGRGNCRYPKPRWYRQPRDGITTGGWRWGRAGSQNTAHSSREMVYRDMVRQFALLTFHTAHGYSKVTVG